MMSLGKSFDEPELSYVDTPIHDKKADARCKFSVPMYLPSTEFRKQLLNHQEPATLEDDMLAELGPTYVGSLAYRRALEERGLHWSRIIPLSIYFDGVQYSKRDSFHGFYFRDLRKNETCLSFLLRTFF